MKYYLFKRNRENDLASERYATGVVTNKGNVAETKSLVDAIAFYSPGKAYLYGATNPAYSWWRVGRR